jgi:hypothetical protein
MHNFNVRSFKLKCFTGDKSRWIETITVKSGIDINVYSAHSVRSAASSKVRQRFVPIREIMEKAGWSNTSTFFKFYNKPIKEKRAITFEDAVLQTQDKIEVTKVFITFNSQVYKQTKSVNNRKTVKTVMTLTWYRHF